MKKKADGDVKLNAKLNVKLKEKIEWGSDQLLEETQLDYTALKEETTNTLPPMKSDLLRELLFQKDSEINALRSQLFILQQALVQRDQDQEKEEGGRSKHRLMPKEGIRGYLGRF